MKFLFPCEEVVKKYLPAMRAGIAKRLHAKGFTQQKIAEELGLSQAAVSKYLSNDYNVQVRVLEKKKELGESCDSIANNIASGSWDQKHVNSAICKTCVEFNAQSLSCNLLSTLEHRQKA